MNQRIDRVVLWRREDLPGLEYCAMRQGTDGWQLEATVLGALDGLPMKVSYQVVCDTDWRTRSVEVRCVQAADERRLALRADTDGRWWNGAEEVATVRGSVDVDLGASPSTNTLPIRRLSLAVGESHELTAAWVRFPDLEVSPLRQRYTRTGERTYRYESVESDFTAELTVDDDGLVMSYLGIWERVLGA